MKFKVIAGQHIGEAKGYTYDEETKTYSGPAGDNLTVVPETLYGVGTPAGVFFESDVDMVKLHGDKKFAYADEATRKEAEKATAKEMKESKSGLDEEVRPKLETVKNSIATPMGCVYEGIQVTTGTPDGGSISGPMTEDSVPQTKEEKRKSAKAEKAVEKEESKPTHRATHSHSHSSK